MCSIGWFGVETYQSLGFSPFALFDNVLVKVDLFFKKVGLKI